MIRFEHVTFRYAGAQVPALADVNLAIPEGELCVVVGPTGSGKSTLLRAVNGLVPWFTGGTLEGRITVGGRSTAEHAPRELADLVGVVSQTPSSDFVTDVVEDELAYTMENLGVAPAVMRRRVEEVLDLLGLHDVRQRALRNLSSGEQQRVAIGSVLAASPRVLVLDEPTSALDPGAAEEVLAALTRLVHDLGLTAIVAEHRLERVVQYADRVVVIHNEQAGGQGLERDGAPSGGPSRGRVVDGAPAEMMGSSPVAPPVVELGRMAGWSPLPLSVRDARRAAAGLRDRLGAPPSPVAAERPADDDGARSLLARTRGARASYGSVTALAGVDLDVRRGEVVAVMGRNGAGKSTLLSLLAGLRPPGAGNVSVGGDPPHRLAPPDLVRRVALVPSDPALLLYAGSVAEECEQADRDTGLEAGTTTATVAEVVAGLSPEAHPRDLSEGERLSLTLGIVLAPGPPLLLLDEPTRGLDYGAKRRLVQVLRDLVARYHGVVLATHDVELVAEVASRVVVLADGEIVADGPVRDVVASSSMFAPQVTKILSPSPWLTVTEVREALGVGV